MHISVITLFPDMFSPVLNSSIMKRAQEKGKIAFTIVNLRDFGLGVHHVVDDKPYGGGAGMVLKVDVLHSALKSVQKNHPKTRVILLDPKGTPFTETVAESLTKHEDITLICGHYEGYDARIEKYIDQIISLGDFVLTGGEIPALAIIDATVRLIPGVLGKDESSKHESFSDKNGKRILEHKHYTRPDIYEGVKVPDILLSGDHKKVEAHRLQEAEDETRIKRPDLSE